MANEITVTVADVRPLLGAIVRRKTAGGTFYAGDAVYIAADGDVEAADGSAIGTVLGTFGVAVADADGSTTFSAGDAVDVVILGPVTGFSSMTPGAVVYVSDTVGRLSTVAGTKSVIVGQSESAVTVNVRPETIDLT